MRLKGAKIQAWAGLVASGGSGGELVTLLALEVHGCITPSTASVVTLPSSNLDPPASLL